MKTFSLILFLSLAATADILNPLSILNGSRPVVCHGDDNISIVLNAQHTTLKYTVEGESLGPVKIVKVSTDHSSYVSYISSEGWLTFNARGSYYRATGEQQSSAVDCKIH